jgi:hypothetical protein
MLSGVDTVGKLSNTAYMKGGVVEEEEFPLQPQITSKPAYTATNENPIRLFILFPFSMIYDNLLFYCRLVREL